VSASLAALRQSDMKRIIAYSSIAHMNLVVIGIFALNVNSLNGSIFQMISHGLVSCGLFGIVGVLYHRYHTRLIQYYGGVAHFMPIFVFFFLFLTLANISLPITSSFIGEFLLFIGIFKSDILVLLFSLTSLVLGGAYMLWLFNRISYASVKKYLYYISDVSEKEFLFLFLFSFFVLLLGIKPDFLINYFNVSSLSSTLLQLLKLV
jgi:NADH-quinone oxidoreductase subunit M